MAKRITSFRLSEEALERLLALGNHWRMSQGQVVEALLMGALPSDCPEAVDKKVLSPENKSSAPSTLRREIPRPGWKGEEP